MSRRRYISTAISLDKNVNQLARSAGDFAALLYTWMIPHAEDDASMTGDPEELLCLVVPGRRDKDTPDIEAALGAMDTLRLLRWDRAAGRIYFDTDSFYRYQTYIPPAKRAQNSDRFTPSASISEEQRETPKNAASLSPSPSPSRTSSSAGADDGFDEFWMEYPRKVGKAEARKRWNRASKADRDGMTLAARSIDAWANDTGTELQFIPHPATFIGPKRSWEDWRDGWPDGYGGQKADDAPKDNYCPNDGATLAVDGHCPVCEYVKDGA